MATELPTMGKEAPFVGEDAEITMKDTFGEVYSKGLQVEAAPPTTEGERGEPKMNMV